MFRPFGAIRESMTAQTLGAAQEDGAQSLHHVCQSCGDASNRLISQRQLTLATQLSARSPY